MGLCQWESHDSTDLLSKNHQNDFENIYFGLEKMVVLQRFCSWHTTQGITWERHKVCSSSYNPTPQNGMASICNVFSNILIMHSKAIKLKYT